MQSHLLYFWKRVFAVISVLCRLDKTLLAFALVRLYSKAKLNCYSGYLDFLLLYPNPMMKRISFLVLVLKGLVDLHRTIQLQLLQHYWLGHRLGLLWYWMVHWNWTEIILSFLRLHPRTAFQTLTDYEGYSISSKGFLPTVIDIMVIWVKFTHSSPF